LNIFIHYKKLWLFFLSIYVLKFVDLCFNEYFEVEYLNE